MQKLHPLRAVTEHLPRFYGSFPGASESTGHVSREALRVEKARQSLMWGSEKIRTHQDRDPEQTVARLSTVALDLFASNAPEFEKVATLNETHANLLAGGRRPDEIRTIANLSLKALDAAFPETKDNPTSSALNHDEIATRLEAILTTTPDNSFPQALEKVWETRGHPIDPLLTRTGDLIEAADKNLTLNKVRQEMDTLRAKSSAESATEKTGAGQIERYNPFADDEDNSNEVTTTKAA